jgi:probable F420-dependent oxidoreductase
MKIGVVFPQTDIGCDAGGIRDYAQAVEAMGYAHILAYDHVLGANPDRPGGWSGFYGYRDAFHEPFVLFGFLAAVTRRIELMTGIVILPQRPTALVAKQAAAVDVLSGGRLRLGVGIGWNAVEYEALGENFRNRGQRIEEQIELMRALWTKELVTFDGRWHRVSDAGLNPLPVQRPIPVWMGGQAEAVLERAGRVADGWTWMSSVRPGEDAQALIDRVHGVVSAAGRNARQFGIEGRITLARLKPDHWAAELAAWRAMRGVTHVCVDTMRLGVSKPDEHIELLRRFNELAKA